MPVNNPFALTAGIQYVDGTASTATSFTGTVAMSFNASNLIVGLRSDANDNLLVTGTLTHNNAAPIANNFGVLPAVASSAAPTYNAGDQVLLSTDLAGNLRVNATFTGTATNNITQWNSVNLGSPSAYGTSPGAVNVIGVNAFVTNTVAVSGTVTVNQGTSPWVVSLTSTTITGTVAVTQSTSPWVVAGALTNNNAAPTATLIGVMDHIAETAYATVTYTTGDVVLATTDLHGATNVDLQAYAGTALGAGSNYGTSPGAVNVMGVNAFITNTVPVTLTSTTITGTVAVTQSTSPWVVSLTSTTITGTVAVTQSTSPWVVSGNLTHNNAAPAANNVGVLPAVASTAAPTYTTGDQVLLSTDLAGNLRVTFAAASEQNVNLNQWAGTNLGTPANYGTSPGAVVAGSVNAFVTNTVPVTLTSTTITGTVAVTQSTSPWVVSLASTTITGTVAVTQSTSPWVVGGALTNNNAAPAATNLGVLPAIAETAYTTVTYTTGDQVLPVTDLHGALNQDLQAYAGTQLTGTVTAYGTAPTGNVFGVNAFVTNTVAVTMTSTTITGTVAVTQSTSPWVVNATQWASTALGTPQTFGTAPTGVVVGTSSDIYIAGTRARSNQTTTAAGVMDVNIVGSLGATNSVTNGTFIEITDGTTKAGVIATTTALKTDMSSVAGTATSTAAAGIQKVGISGATGVTLDAVITAATAPANAIASLSVYQATQPSLTTGQSVALQNDSAGNLQISLGCNVTTGATLPTALNSVQYITGTATIGAPIGKPAVVIQLDQTTTITAGAVTFEGTYDGTNWVTIPVAQVVHPETFALLTNPYTLQASTNQPFLILMQGYQNVRIRVSTAITGTGTVTPYWDSRNVAPLQAINVTANPSGGTSVATGSIGATKTAIKTSAGAVYGW